MDDLISRQAAIDALYELFRNRPLDYGRVQIRGDVLMKIENLPSAERRGRWIVRDNDYIDDCECSECGCVEYFNKGWKRFNYCPSCGAKMDKEENE